MKLKYGFTDEAVALGGIVCDCCGSYYCGGDEISIEQLNTIREQRVKMGYNYNICSTDEYMNSTNKGITFGVNVDKSKLKQEDSSFEYEHVKIGDAVVTFKFYKNQEDDSNDLNGEYIK